jgi:hypothetical protein
VTRAFTHTPSKARPQLPAPRGALSAPGRACAANSTSRRTTARITAQHRALRPIGICPCKLPPHPTPHPCLPLMSFPQEIAKERRSANRREEITTVLFVSSRLSEREVAAFLKGLFRVFCCCFPYWKHSGCCGNLKLSYRTLRQFSRMQSLICQHRPRRLVSKG